MESWLWDALLLPQRGGSPRMQLINPDAITKMCNCKVPLLLQTKFLLLSCHHCLAPATLLPVLSFWELLLGFGWVWWLQKAPGWGGWGTTKESPNCSLLQPAAGRGEDSSAETRSRSWWCTVIFRKLSLRIRRYQSLQVKRCQTDVQWQLFYLSLSLEGN